MAGDSNSRIVSYSNGPQLRDWLKGQIFSTIPAFLTSMISAPDRHDRTIIITGANAGLGFEAAKQLLQMGTLKRLILACRSLKRGEKARELLLEATSSQEKAVEVNVWELDMASQFSIKSFSSRVERELDQVDAIILNAGVDLIRYEKASQEDGGYEMTLMVNVVGTIMLATLLIPILKEKKVSGQSSRLTIVGSSVQFAADYQVVVDAANGAKEEGILGWLSDETRWKGKITEARYYLSKGLVQMLVRQLSRRVPLSAKDGTPEVIVNCVNPGWCRTELFKESNTFGSRMGLRLIGWEPEVGARALVVGAIGVEGGQKSHGGYMSEGKVKQCCSWFETNQGEEIAEKMWQEVCENLEQQSRML